MENFRHKGRIIVSIDAWEFLKYFRFVEFHDI